MVRGIVVPTKNEDLISDIWQADDSDRLVLSLTRPEWLYQTHPGLELDFVLGKAITLHPYPTKTIWILGAGHRSGEIGCGGRLNGQRRQSTPARFQTPCASHLSVQIRPVM